MIHIHNRSYLLIPTSKDSEFCSQTIDSPSESHLLNSLYQSQRSDRIKLGEEVFWRTLLSHWINILQDSSEENLDYLISSTLVDQELKGESFQFKKEKILKIGLTVKESFKKTAQPITSINPLQLSFEYILATYLIHPQEIENIFFKKIEYFSWEQIIQEISVIRQEIYLLLNNQNINRFLPDEHKIDPSVDLEIQLYGNPFLSWLLDPEYRYSNVEYFKKNIDLGITTHFYDQWMMERYKIHDVKNANENLDNISWITSRIKAADWKGLFESNLKRNFGCVYLDNSMIHKANQVWGSSLYRDHHSASYESAKRLCLKPEIYSNRPSR